MKSGQQLLVEAFKHVGLVPVGAFTALYTDVHRYPCGCGQATELLTLLGVIALGMRQSFPDKMVNEAGEPRGSSDAGRP